MFRLERPLMQILDKVVDLLVLSVIWFGMCLTVIGIGPATVALYYAVAKSIRQDQGSLYREFFRTVRENWKLSMAYGLVFAACAAALFVFDLPNIAALFLPDSPITAGWSILSIIKTVIVFGLALYLFPLISRYQVTFLGALLTSLTLAVQDFFFTFIMLVLLAAAAVAIGIAPWLILVLPGCLCYLLTFFLEPVLLSILPEDDRQNAEGDRWYLE